MPHLSNLPLLLIFFCFLYSFILLFMEFQTTNLMSLRFSKYQFLKSRCWVF